MTQGSTLVTTTLTPSRPKASILFARITESGESFEITVYGNPECQPEMDDAQPKQVSDNFSFGVIFRGRLDMELEL